MTDINSSPVSLGAGSYDYDALKTGLDKAAKGAAKNYDAAVSKTLEDASTNVAANQDARDIPGYKFVDVENADLGVTERVQVFDPKLAANAEDNSPNGAIPEADLRNQQAQVTADAVAAADSPKE